MDLWQPAPLAGPLPISNAIAALTTTFLSAAQLVARLKSQAGSPHARRSVAEELEKLEQVLLLSEAAVRGVYEDLCGRFGGEGCRVGDAISRFTLYTLSAQQQSRLAFLQNAQLSVPHIRNLVAAAQKTQSAVVNCLVAFKTRMASTVPQGVSVHDQTQLMVLHQNLCPSAGRYLLSQSSFPQLTTSPDRSAGTAACKECGTVFIPSKLPIKKYTSESSFVLVNTSGLLRSHCGFGKGWTCFWQQRDVSCYSVFSDVKALLVHLMDVHVRDDGSGGDIKVDFAKDVGARRELQKCGYGVRIEGLDMKKTNGKFVVPRRVVPLSRARSAIQGPHSVSRSEHISSAASSVSSFSSASTITARSARRHTPVSVSSAAGSVIGDPPPPYTELPSYAAPVGVPEDIREEAPVIAEEIYQAEGNAIYEMEHPSYELDAGREIFEIGGSAQDERERRGRVRSAVNAVRQQIYIAWNPARIGRVEERPV